MEFAFTSLIFFVIVFGTLDFGRAIYQYSQLHNAVREGARVAKVKPTDGAAIRAKVKDTGVGLNLTDANIG
ncbi:MAG: TadE family protein, partial [Thermomicrobiales bacterium]